MKNLIAFSVIAFALFQLTKGQNSVPPNNGGASIIDPDIEDSGGSLETEFEEVETVIKERVIA